MKKLSVFLIVLSIGIVQITAQQFSTTLSGENEFYLRLIDINADIDITVQSGNKIEITADGLPAPPPKAQGLRPLTKSGTDNTGVGLSINIIDEIIELTGGKSAENLNYKLTIPENVNLYVASSGFEEQRNVTITKVSKEIEIFTSSRDILLKDITGPVIARTDRGDIEIIFQEVNQDSPMSIICEDGDIDITLSGSAKATFKLSADEGEMYTDLEMEEMEEDEWGKFLGSGFVGPNNFVWSYNDFYKNFREQHDADRKRWEEIEDAKRGRKTPILLEDMLILPGKPLDDDGEEYDKAQRYYFDAQKWSRPYFRYNFLYDSFFPYDYRGKLNGGGVEISARAQDGNIYLRKK